MAVAASLCTQSLWGQISRDEALLAQCAARHAGRVALQLFAAGVIATWTAPDGAPRDNTQIGKGWCGEQLLDSSQPLGIVPLLF